MSISSYVRLTQLMRSRYLRPWAWLSGWTFFLVNIYCTWFVSQLSRTKAAYLQREIGTSSKTENFANRLGKYEAYNNLAAAQHSPKDCVTATDDYKRNRKTAKERGDIWGEGTVYGNLGTAHDYLGDRKAVVVYHEPHLKNVQVLGDMSGEGTACGYLGNVYYCLEYFKRVKDYCEHHQDQIKKWCGEIFKILIFLLFYVVVVLSSLVLCSVLFRFVMFYFGTPLVLSFVSLLCFVALHSVYIWPRKGGRRNIKKFFWPGKGKTKGYIHINDWINYNTVLQNIQTYFTFLILLN